MNPTTPHIAALWRYPVKSMHGEPPAHATLTPHGVQGDRRYAFESSGAAPGMLRLTGRGRREILRFRAHTSASGEVTIQTPTGITYPAEDPALLHHLTTLFADSHTLTLTQAPTPQTDCRPISLISLQTIEHLAHQLGQPLDPRRFRANLYLNVPEPFWEDTLVGQTIRVGPQAVFRILERDPRCRFITLDPDTAEPLPDLMKLLDRHHQTRVGIYAAVVTPGPITPGDAVGLIT